jgi:hypothetical protein
MLLLRFFWPQEEVNLRHYRLKSLGKVLSRACLHSTGQGHGIASRAVSFQRIGTRNPEVALRGNEKTLRRSRDQDS